MNEEMQQEIFRIDALVSEKGLPGHARSWQRIKASLSPDRQKLAWALFLLSSGADDNEFGRKMYQESIDVWLTRADAAIAAMQGEKP